MTTKRLINLNPVPKGEYPCRGCEYTYMARACCTYYPFIYETRCHLFGLVPDWPQPNDACRAAQRDAQALIEEAEKVPLLLAQYEKLRQQIDPPLVTHTGAGENVPIEQRLFSIADAVPPEDMAQLLADLTERFEEYLEGEAESIRYAGNWV